MSEAGTQHLILRSVRGGSSNTAARGELSRLLRLDEQIVGRIIDRAPIVLVRGVPDGEADMARGGLGSLAMHGIELEITAADASLPKVNWPSPPRLSDFFAVSRGGTGDVTLLEARVATLEARVLALESRLGGATIEAAPVAQPYEAASASVSVPAPAAAPARAPAMAAAAPPMGPATGPSVRAHRAAAAELYWGGASEFVAMPSAETGDDFHRDGAPARSGASPAREPAGRVVQEVAPLPDEPEETLEELEPLSLGDDMPGGEELEPILAPKGGAKAPPAPAPATAKAPAAPGKPAAKPAADDDDLPAWSGPAREYKPAPTPAGKPGAAAAKPAAKAGGADDTDAEDELQPWTGRARDYKSDRNPAAKSPAASAAPAKPGPAKPLPGKAPAAPAPVARSKPTPAEEIEDLPELDLDSGDDKPLVAPTMIPAEDTPADASEDLPELEPVLVPDRGLKRPAPAGSPPGARKTGPIPKPAPAPASTPGARKTGPIPKPAPAPAPKAADESGQFSVFLSKIANPSRKQVAIELLCKLKGITEDEADALCAKMIIPVVQGVSEAKAKEILDKFAAQKIQGRMTKKRD